MKEQFCDYEISLKLKELNFNEFCLAGYSNEEFTMAGKTSSSYQYEWINAPLWQQAEQFLREKYHLHIILWYNRLTDKWRIDDILDLKEDKECYWGKKEYSTYEECRREGIIEALKSCQKEK